MAMCTHEGCLDCQEMKSHVSCPYFVILPFASLQLLQSTFGNGMLLCRTQLNVIECFHMTSRRPYWCPKTINPIQTGFWPRQLSPTAVSKNVMSHEYGLAVAFEVHACIDFLIARTRFPQEGSSDLQLATSDFGLPTFHHFLFTSQLKINSFPLLQCGHIFLEIESILTDNFKVKTSRGDRARDPY